MALLRSSKNYIGNERGSVVLVIELNFVPPDVFIHFRAASS